MSNRMTTQICTNCAEELPLERFQKCADRGYRRQCKSCRNEKARAWNKRTGRMTENSRAHYARNKDNPEWMSKLRKRIYKKRRENPAIYKRIQNRYNKNNVEKLRERDRYYAAQPEAAARRKLRYEVKKGRIHRPDQCSACSAKCKPHGHHTDYSKPLDVVWLCKACHVREHLKYRD